MQVLHRKTEEAAAATKRLKELLEARKSSKENTTNGTLECLFCLLLLQIFYIARHSEVVFIFILHLFSVSGVDTTIGLCCHRLISMSLGFFGRCWKCQWIWCTGTNSIFIRFCSLALRQCIRAAYLYNLVVQINCWVLPGSHLVGLPRSEHCANRQLKEDIWNLDL